MGDLTPLQEVLMVSGGLFWAYMAVRLALAVRKSIKTPKLEVDDFDPDGPSKVDFSDADYTWVYGKDNDRPPMRVPTDMAPHAITILNRENVGELNKKLEPWTFTVDLQNIRQAIVIAYAEPDIEMAMATWLANSISIPKEDDPRETDDD